MPEGEVAAAALLPHGEHAEEDVAHVEQRVVRRGQRSEVGGTEICWKMIQFQSFNF